MAYRTVLKLAHSAKGSTWEDHKYVKRVNGTYYYPAGYTKGRTIDELGGGGDKKEDRSGEEGPDYGEEDIEALAREVIRGNFANGEERKQLLGEYYQKVQSRVNEILRSGGSSKMSDSKAAEEVGKKGIAAIVNEKLAAKKVSSEKEGRNVYSVYDKQTKRKAKNRVEHSALSHSLAGRDLSTYLKRRWRVGEQYLKSLNY